MEEKLELSEEEIVNIMVKFASEFVEFYEDQLFDYYVSCGYKGSRPERFHPGVADKYLFRKLMQNAVGDVSAEFRTRHNARLFAEKVLFNNFYPFYAL